MLNWVVIISTVMGAVASGLLPPLASVYGERAILALAMAALAGGSVLAAVAVNGWVLMVGRFIAAFGVGAVALSLVVSRTNLAGRQLGLALGCIAAAEGAASGIGFVLGGLVTETIHVGWRAIFWLLSILAILLTALVIRVIPPGAGQFHRRVDWLGGLLLGSGLVLVLVPVSAGPSWGWLSAKVIGMVLAGAAVLVAWWFIEDRVREPMIDTHALRDRNFIAGAAIFCLSAMLVWIINFSLPTVAGAPQSTGFGLGYGALMSGLILLPMGIGIAASGTAAGYLNRWLSSRSLCLIGFGFAVLSMFLLAVAHDHTWQLWVWPALYAISYGLCVTGGYETFLRSARQDQAASVAAIGQTSGLVGASIAGAAITAVLTSDVVVVGDIAVPTIDSLTLGWWLGVAMAIAGMLVTLAIRRKRTVAAESEASLQPSAG